ncbi:MAG: hypothetical protein GY696_07720 [Gammaproteobacteria bacterium]|nr:hypothetical protein [Gammaproteobacteria bacterium]
MKKQQPCVVGPKIVGPQSPMSRTLLLKKSIQSLSLLYARAFICLTFLWAFLAVVHSSFRYYNDDDL